MTCKISFIKSIREIMKHHLAAIFSTCIVFFIQFIVYFLNIQNYTSNSALDYSYRLERLTEITLPSFGYVVPVIFVAVLLAFDFFRYLHSKKQVDFYDSLPMRRKDWFLLRASSAFTIFIIPYSICTILEMALLVVFDVATYTLIENLLWNFICMIFIFLITWLTGVLAMIMTGHSVISLFGFAVFSSYAPLILRYIYPAYAHEYFKTYVTDDTSLHLLEYFSPIGLAYKLIYTNYLDWTPKSHVTDFIVIIIMIALVGILTYRIFLKRPSEAAGRAMAFEKWNPVIRILLVIPISLYIGLYLSLITSVSSKIWMVFGFLFGTVLLNGMIESIFQFDIHGLWSHKKQMLCCFAACLGIAFLFWTDFFKYDDYLPELKELDAIVIHTNDSYYDGGIRDGITGDYLDDALLLAETLVKQDFDIDDEKDWISFEYHLSNGNIKQRQYYIDYELNQELFDKIYASREYKDDLCPLYDRDWNETAYIEWQDSICEFALYISDDKMEHLFETYLAEYTPLTYSQVRTVAPLGEFIVCYDNDSQYHNFSCYVYPEFTQTISILEEILQDNQSTKDYGPLSESVIYKYQFHSLEIYTENAPIIISELNKLEILKDDMILSEYFHKKYNVPDWNLYYEGQLSLVTSGGLRYTSVILPKSVIHDIIENIPY